MNVKAILIGWGIFSLFVLPISFTPIMDVLSIQIIAEVIYGAYLLGALISGFVTGYIAKEKAISNGIALGVLGPILIISILSSGNAITLILSYGVIAMLAASLGSQFEKSKNTLA